jgi:hypothetical protein
MAKETHSEGGARFSERVRAAAGALKEARASGLEQVVVRDGPRGYAESAERSDRQSAQAQSTNK